MFYWCINICIVLSETRFTITSSSRYKGSLFKCVDGDDCTFNCNGAGNEGTTDSSICSTSGTSYSTQYYFGACDCSTITCNGGAGKYCRINCNEISSCYKNSIYCGDDSLCSIYCKNKFSCSNSNIYCGDRSICNIYCNGYKSCSGSNIECGINSTCNIQCDAHGQYADSSTNKDYECGSINIVATQSHKLTVDVYNNLYSARYMQIYAPNINNINLDNKTSIKCGINTYNNASTQYSCDQIKIHSVQGWNDVEVLVDGINTVTIDNVFQDLTSENQQMYCGSMDEYFCYGYKSNNIECHHEITICNNQTLSDSPTQSPTNDPISSDPTDSPTNQPSESPSINPTKSPLEEGETGAPSLASQSPTTKLPTKSPLDEGETAAPTLTSVSPTDDPTDDPTSIVIIVTDTTETTETTETDSPTTSPLGIADSCYCDYRLIRASILLLLFYIVSIAS